MLSHGARTSFAKWQQVLRYLSHCSGAVKRHHGHGNSCKQKHLSGPWLQFQSFSPLSTRWETWQCAGQHGVGEGAESSATGSPSNEKSDTGPGLGF